MNKLLQAVFIIISTLLIDAPSTAATRTASTLEIPLHPTARVVANCAIGTVQPIRFAPYDPTNKHTTLTAQGTVTASCTLDTHVSIHLSTPNPSYLYPVGGAGTVNRLSFTLSASGTGSAVGGGSAHPLTVIVTASMPPAQDVPAGSYQDNGDNYVAFNF